MILCADEAHPDRKGHVFFKRSKLFEFGSSGYLADACFVPAKYNEVEAFATAE